MDKKEFWEQSLEKLEKNPIKQPIKKDYDVRRQRKILEETKIREKLDRLVESIKEEQLQRKQLTEQLNLLKNEPIYREHEHQMSVISASSRGIREHLEKQKELKNKRIAFRKVLGQYKSMAILEEDINQIEQNISRGNCKSLQEERKLIAKITKLQKLKPAVLEYETNENHINCLNKDPEYVQQQQVKSAQSVEMEQIKKKKQEVDGNISLLKDNLDKVWTSLKTMYEKKSELHAQVDACSREAKQVAIEYRQKEGEYSRYQQNLQRAHEQVERERRRTELEAKDAAERKMYEEAIESATKVSRQEMVVQGMRQQEAAQKQKQREQAAKRNRDRASGGGQDGTTKTRRKKKDEPEEVKKSMMVDVIIPFYKELQQLRACKGYLQSFMPKQPTNSNSNSNSNNNNKPQRRKKKRKKPRGALKHNLNWLQAFSECGCSKQLVNRRENVEEAYKELCERLDGLEAKSEAAKKGLESPKEEEVVKKEVDSTAAGEKKSDPSVEEEAVKKAADEGVPAVHCE